MLEISTSAVAWISVVVVQFLVHYIIFGIRRERIIQETDAVLLEESLSFSTNEGATDSDCDLASAPNTPTNDPYFSSVSSLSSASLIEGNTTPSSSELALSDYSSDRKVYIELSATDRVENTPFYLMQTGNEMLRSCSLKNVVEEKIRSVPQ